MNISLDDLYPVRRYDRDIINARKEGLSYAEIDARLNLRSYLKTSWSERAINRMRAEYRRRYDPLPPKATCLNCGRQFQPLRKGVNNGKYCRYSCGSEYRRKVRMAGRPPSHKKNCVSCGNVFETRNTRQRWCSAECREGHLKSARDAARWERVKAEYAELSKRYLPDT